MRTALKIETDEYKRALAGDSAFFDKHTQPDSAGDWTHDPLGDLGQTWMHRTIYEPWMRRFSAAVKRQAGPHATVVDLGCGPGGTSLWLATQGHHVFGVDASEKRITAAQATAKRYRQTIKAAGGSLNYACADFFDFNPIAKVAAVFSMKTFHHVPDPLSLIRRYAKIMGHEGMFGVLDQIGLDQKNSVFAAMVAATLPPGTCRAPMGLRARLVAYRILAALGRRNEPMLEMSPLEDIGAELIVDAFERAFSEFSMRPVDPLRLVFAAQSAKPKWRGLLAPWVLINRLLARAAAPSMEYYLEAQCRALRLD